MHISNRSQQSSLIKWLRIAVLACILITLGSYCFDTITSAVSWLIGIVMPLLIGFALALIINVPMRFLESHIWTKTKRTSLQKLRRPTAFIISLVFIFGMIVGIVWLVIPELIEAIKVIIQGVIGFINRIAEMDQTELAELPFGNAVMSVDWDKLLSSLQEWLKNRSGTIVNTAIGTISSLVGGIFDFIVSLIFAIYILFSKDKLKRQISRLVRAWLPKGLGDWLIHAASITSANFRNFISGQTLEAVILGLLCMIGMLIFQIPYAPMVGALVGVTALIPVMGAFIGTIVGAFMILTVSPPKAIIFVVFLLVLQQLEGNIIYPRVMGSRVNLPAMWILAAVTIGGGVAGPIGMLIAVPITSSIYVLVREATENREKRKTDKVQI